jgi:hypothetical protein
MPPTMNPKKRIGEMLLEAGIIDETQLKAALGHQRQWGVRLGQALVDLKLATEPDIVRALSLKFGFEVANLGALEPYGHAQAVKLVPREFAVRNNLFPMWADTASLTVAMSDPTNLSVVDEVRFRTGRRVKVCIGGDHELADAVRRTYGGPEVEAIALDEAGAGIEGESVFDPFGGGSKEAFDAMFVDPSAGPAAPPSTPAPGGGAAPLRPPAGAASPRAAQLELEEPLTAESDRGAPPGEEAVELASLAEGPESEPVLASELAPDGADASPELSPRELALIDALDRLAAGGPSEPDVVKPVQAMAAMIRLLIRKRIVTEQEFLDELSRR